MPEDRGPSHYKGSKGGRGLQDQYTSANGYRYIKVDGSWVAFHRYAMEQHLGRPLERGERVKFKNGDKSDFSLDNLELSKPTTEKKAKYGRIDELYELIDDLTIRLQNIEQIHQDELKEFLDED